MKTLWVSGIGVLYALVLFDDVLLRLALISLVVFYEVVCLHHKVALLLLLACFWPSQLTDKPQAGHYQVIEVRNHYALAKQNQWTVLVYGQFEYDQVLQLNHFVRCHQEVNDGSFDFVSYLSKQGVDYQAKQSQIIHQIPSLKAWLHQQFSHPVLRQLFYGQSENQSYLAQLGLGYMSLIYWLERQLKRWFSTSTINVLMTGLCWILILCFGLRIALCRLLCMRLARCLCQNRDSQMVIATYLVALWMPSGLTQAGFLMPMWLQIVGHQKRLLANVVAQILFFGSVNPILVLAYPFLKRHYCWFMLPIFGPMLSFITQLEWPIVPGFLTTMLALLAYRFPWLLLACLCFPWINPVTTVTILSVGQADCTIIQAPFHQEAVMIDCGQVFGQKTVDHIIGPYLKQHHIHEVKLWITHQDADHNGGVKDLKKWVRVQPAHTKPYFHSLLKKREAHDENEKSKIHYFRYDQFRYLWMGDASQAIEKQLMAQYDLKADFVKLGHHGASTSSHPSFLQAIEPRLAIISAGYHNRYHHPSPITQETLKRLSIPGLNTAQVGQITIHEWGPLHWVSTASGLFILL